MKTRITFPNGRQQGKALLMVIAMAGATCVVLFATLQWARTNNDLCARNNQLFRCQAAAEAATEKVIAHIGNDYQNYGVKLVNANLASYRTIVPAASDYAYWSNYQFEDEASADGRTTVDFLPVNPSAVLSTKYTGLRGFAYDMRIVSNAREPNSMFNVVGRNEQKLLLSLVPIFQYAIFYNTDLEFTKAAPMVVAGPVHCNANVYCKTATTLDFMSQVTAVGKVLMTVKPGDPSSFSMGTVNFHGTPKYTEGVPSLNLPIGTNNSPSAVHQLLEIPPWTESPNSLMGQLRYYNQADLVVLVSNSTVRVTSGGFNSFGTSISWTQASAFVKTNASFFDNREDKIVRLTDIDVGQLRQWNNTNEVAAFYKGAKDVRTLYVGDCRTAASGTMTAVRLINGTWLPKSGLTVATFNPLYVKGHYNVSTNGTASNLGAANTTHTLPASIASDAITILSTNWLDSANQSAVMNGARATTVNAAILAGNTETTSGFSGGGVHNLTRFLEDWNNVDFTLNTSIVSMFPSQNTTGRFVAPGATGAYYRAPNRNWSFDANFNDPNKLPPATPQVRFLFRGTWSD